MLYKSFRLNVKQLDMSTGVFEGYASTFGNPDAFNDVIMPGAFARTLAAWENRGLPVPILWQHDPSMPVGATLRAAEDEVGLFIEAQLLTDIQKAKEALIALKAGVLGGLSIGFSIPEGKFRFDEETQTRQIFEVKLFETSLVTWPANEQARITAVKQNDMIQALTQASQDLREAAALLKGGHSHSTGSPADSPPPEHSPYGTAEANRIRQEFLEALKEDTYVI